MTRIFTLLFFILTYATSNSQDSMLVANLKAQAHPLMMGEKWTGGGADILMDAAQSNHFFLIGEPHGVADVALFTADLIRKIKPFGYHCFLAETGPYTAGILESYGDDLRDNISKHLTQYPISLPFYTWVEEADVIDAILENNPMDGPKIWGLDQEFAASYRMFFQWLEDNAATHESKSIATTYSDLADKSFTEAFEQKNPGASIMGRLSPADFDKLINAFIGQEACLDLIGELRETTQIYQLWFQRQGYESNRLRAELMKRHFHQYYNNAKNEGDVKAIGKMGTNHFYKGRNALNVHDIGNHLHELASVEGTSSFHLYILPVKGTVNAWNPFTQNEADRNQSFDNREGEDAKNYQPLFSAMTDGDYTIIDLIPLRTQLFNRSLKIENEWMEKLIWSYDAVLMMQDVKAASNY